MKSFLNSKKHTAYLLVFLISIFFGFSFYSLVLAEGQLFGTLSVLIIDPSSIQGTVHAIPEKRIPNISDSRVENESTRLKLTFYNAGADRSDSMNIVTTTYVTTSDSGTGYYAIDAFVTSTFDVVAKGYSHLSRLLSGVAISSYQANLDFTSNGTNPLLSGDINQTEGDDEINALDISVLVNKWGQTDSRADLNQDLEVNSIDISNLLSNFNELGD